MNALVEVVNGLNFFHVAASTAAQLIFAFLWFHYIVKHIDNYYLAADKGVRRVDHIVFRYPEWLVGVSNVATAALRSVILLTFASSLKATTLVEYEYVALLVALVGMTRLHRHFSCHRPFQLFITEGGYEVAASLITALVCFLLTNFSL